MICKYCHRNKVVENDMCLSCLNLYHLGWEKAISELKKLWAHEYGNDEIDYKSYKIFMRLVEKLENGGDK